MQKQAVSECVCRSSSLVIDRAAAFTRPVCFHTCGFHIEFVGYFMPNAKKARKRIGNIEQKRAMTTFVRLSSPGPVGRTDGSHPEAVAQQVPDPRRLPLGAPGQSPASRQALQRFVGGGSGRCVDAFHGTTAKRFASLHPAYTIGLFRSRDLAGFSSILQCKVQWSSVLLAAYPVANREHEFIACGAWASDASPSLSDNLLLCACRSVQSSFWRHLSGWQ